MITIFAKIKYILFDYSDDFKNDFLALFKKSIAFFILGIIFYAFRDTNDTLGAIGAFAIVIFGVFWARNLMGFFMGLAAVPNNLMIKITIGFIVFVISFALGYVYFSWCIIKMIIILVKKLTANKQ